MKIAIFDSGIGGLCLLSELRRRLPNAEFIYYADSDHAPYGEREAADVLSLTEEAVERMLGIGAAAILLACNTATAVAAKHLRARYPQIPIFGMEPAVNQAARETPRGLILAAATPVTLRGEKFHSLLRRAGIEDRVVSLPLPRLVRYAEGELFAKGLESCPEAAEYIENEIKTACPHVESLSAAVLGCTHFIYFKNEFSRILPDLPIYDGVCGTANHLIRTLGLSESADGGGAECLAPCSPATAPPVEFLISGRRVTESERSRFENCLRLLG